MVGWTIGIEMLFYLIAPWLVRRKWLVLAILFTISLSIRIILANLFGDIAPWNYMFFPTQIMFFIGGVFSYRLYKTSLPCKTSKRTQQILYLILVALVALYYQFFTESYVKNAILFITVILIMPFAFELTKKNKVDRFLGNLSYPVYISQMLIIKIVAAKRFPKLIDRGTTTLIIVIIFAFVLERIVGVYLERV